MKIGIISDTHIVKEIEVFIRLLNTHLRNVDKLEVKDLLNEKEIVSLEGYRIGFLIFF